MTVFTAEHRLDGDRSRTPVAFMSALFAGGWIWEHPFQNLAAAGWPVLRTQEPICALDRTVAGSMERLGDAFLESCADAGFDEVVVCANSMGGLVAIDLAGRYPERVRAIVVSGAPGLSADPDVGLSVDRRASVRLDSDDFRERMLAALFHRGRYFSEEQLERTAELLRRPSSMVSMARSLKATRRYSIGAALDKVTCPSLYVWGRFDRMTPIEPWRELVAHRPHTEFVAVDDCGHIPMIEKAEEYTTRLERFLTGTALPTR
ncbi:alpha/beta hydrolase [Actinoalloteichus sp. AHMU CJ021]|uniref:alpha/beta fold hydrolase n=1 Tax=Actinoalloteichus sp. AHMU CJ021 TaxID=2072503 RepID=UPI000CA056EE|nr:alpha/beta hydrolase [Actinoalloteichus sp. AHMU CJ021]